MELASRLRVGHAPAVLAEVSEAGDVPAEEGGELAPAVLSVALVTQLVIQNVGLYFDLGGEGARGAAI